jgi:nucleoside-diphosphate-sugar epimerase
MDKKIYITGINGFVGSNLTLYLNCNGYDIHEFSLRTRHLLNQPPSDLKIVIHLAGIAHDLKNVSKPNIYYDVNYKLTKEVYEIFLNSNATTFITISSIKAIADSSEVELTEESLPCPQTHYGLSKLMADDYIFSKSIPEGKNVYILRPCMIHGAGNKGNLNLLFNIVSKGIPWPLGAFTNKRSFCSLENLLFIIKELIQRDDIPSGIYNIADDDSLSTNELIKLIAESQGKKVFIWIIHPIFIKIIAKLGNIFNLPLNQERLNKLTETYLVSNKKILQAINKPLPFSSREGFSRTFNSFKNNK